MLGHAQGGADGQRQGQQSVKLAHPPEKGTLVLWEVKSPADPEFSATPCQEAHEVSDMRKSLQRLAFGTGRGCEARAGLRQGKQPSGAGKNRRIWRKVEGSLKESGHRGALSRGRLQGA